MADRDLLKVAKTAMDRASEMKVKMAARRLIVPDDRPGKKAIIIAPTIGRKIIVVKYGKSNYTDSFLTKDIKTDSDGDNA